MVPVRLRARNLNLGPRLPLIPLGDNRPNPIGLPNCQFKTKEGEVNVPSLPAMLMLARPVGMIMSMMVVPMVMMTVVMVVFVAVSMRMCVRTVAMVVMMPTMVGRMAMRVPRRAHMPMPPTGMGNRHDQQQRQRQNADH